MREWEHVTLSHVVIFECFLPFVLPFARTVRPVDLGHAECNVRVLVLG